MSSTCFPDPAVNEDTWLTSSTGTIVNIAPAVDDSTVEPLIKALAAKLQPRNVQVNCVLLPPSVDTVVVDDTAALSHTILFLLSPASRLLTGSVLRIQQDKTSTQAAEKRKEESATERVADVINSHSI
ncbi:uncharacterized protein PITG_14702 [Phytophthora infestans T30-4]|uniref:Uncharacterized protein n=2 Tax=Phytophthora infestans TaxID=4787 RepID=D0NQW2_PHYIT|nr:uncharacterized protein PITG_14702 [Phytophthora infestans T30-4]EEY63060.1 conserved hypothetical protein [Phytophthora infestans T30-4]|eukprot:XP_002898583.1 conserved hypothetical protein [Phytophthora infestans T30-4]